MESVATEPVTRAPKPKFQFPFLSHYAISGAASFKESIVANSVTSSSNFKVEALNVSGRAIVLLLAYFDEAGPHGGRTQHPVGLTTSSGCHSPRRFIRTRTQPFAKTNVSTGDRRRTQNRGRCRVCPVCRWFYL